jgi:N-acetylneuraminic acid mutarotase
LFDGSVLTTVEAYDPITNKWSTKAPLPVGVDSMTATVDNGLIYVVGGLQDSNGTPYNGVQTYDPSSDTWSSVAPLSVAKAFAYTGTVGTKIVAAGGTVGNGPSDDNEVYDPSTNAWTTMLPVKLQRYAGCAGGIGDSLYIAGGLRFSPFRGTTRELDAYDVVTDQWHRLANMPRPMLGLASATVNGQLYCIGGSPFLGQPIFSNAVQIYQP